MVSIKAVIPAGGLGTRFLPLTKSQPKEMLPVVDKPTIQWVLEEAVDAGITDVAIITGNQKDSIRRHFTNAAELENLLLKSNKIEELNKVKALSSMANIEFINQDEPKGLGHAILCAKDFIGKSSFVVLLGDTICVGKDNCTSKLKDLYEVYKTSVFAVEEVPKNEVERYGIISGQKIGEQLYKVENLIEKPSINEAPSQLAIIGRYLFLPSIFEKLGETESGRGNEIQLTDAMQKLLYDEDLIAWEFKGTRYDIGTLETWIKSNYELTLRSHWKKAVSKSKL